MEDTVETEEADLSANLVRTEAQADSFNRNSISEEHRKSNQGHF
jgi:hypothetical protein